MTPVTTRTATLLAALLLVAPFVGADAASVVASGAVTAAKGFPTTCELPGTAEVVWTEGSEEAEVHVQGTCWTGGTFFEAGQCPGTTHGDIACDDGVDNMTLRADGGFYYCKQHCLYRAWGQLVRQNGGS